MSLSAIPLQHPLERCVSAVSAAIDDASGSGAHFLATPAKREVLLGLSREIARLEGLRLGVLAAAGDVAEEDAARTPGAWLAVEARLERPEGRRLQALAEALDRRYGALTAALLEGEVSRPQAEAIAGALDELPHDLEPELRGRAEHLVEQAAEFGPRELRVLGRRVLDVVARRSPRSTSDVPSSGRRSAPGRGCASPAVTWARGWRGSPLTSPRCTPTCWRPSSTPMPRPGVTTSRAPNGATPTPASASPAPGCSPRPSAPSWGGCPRSVSRSTAGGPPRS